MDGIWGTIKGLGTLVGFGGWEAMGQAWKGLAQLATGLALSSIPGVGSMFWSLPDDKLPGWIRDSRTAMKETGKALVAWDEWGKNPARAAGAVTFNVLTTVFTGGVGGAAAGAGKAGAVAKALSVAGKAGRVIDPMTYIMKGAGAGLSKIGDISAALKGVGNIDIPALPENAFALPEGAVKLPDGTFDLPPGTALPDGATRLPDGNVKLPDDAVVLPPGSVKLPTTDGVPAQYMDPDGNLLDGGGNPVQQAADGPGDIVDQPGARPDTPGADVPRVDSPVREPALVGAGAHTVDNAGQVIRLGDDGLGRAGDDLNGPGNSLPTNELDNTHGSRGDAGPGRTSPQATSPHVESGTGRPETPAGDGGSHSGGLPPGGSHEPLLSGSAFPHSPDDLPGAMDDAATGAEDAARNVDESTSGAEGGGRTGDESAQHRAEYESARDKPVEERTPADRAAVTREHVRLANEDPAWRAEHYDKWGEGKRNNADELVDGQPLPKLAEKDGVWVAADDLPYANPERFHLDDMVRGRDTVDPSALNHLDDVSARRTAGMELANAERAYEANPTDEAAQALADAQDKFRTTVGEGVSNNSKLGEALGEEAARRHMLHQEEFAGAREITDLPDTPNGSRRFDQLWRDADGNLVIVEAKGPTARLDWRRGNGVMDSSTMVKQGTVEYVRTILADMEERALFSPKDGQYAKEIRAALKNQTLRYVLVQAAENPGRYAGAELRHFKLF